MQGNDVGAYTTAIGDDGTIYTASGFKLIAISPANETLWSYDASGGQIHSGNVISNFGNGPVCIHNGRIFLLSSNMTADDFLIWTIHALDLPSGNLLWKNVLKSKTGGASTLMIGSTGIVYSNLFSFPNPIVNQLSLPEYDESMLAFEPTTGDIIWKLGFSDYNIFAMESPYDGTIVVAGSNKTKGIHPKTGEYLWTSDDLIGFEFSIDKNGMMYSIFLILLGVIYGVGYQLLAINASNGERIWMKEIPLLTGAW